MKESVGPDAALTMGATFPGSRRVRAGSPFRIPRGARFLIPAEMVEHPDMPIEYRSDEDGVINARAAAMPNHTARQVLR